ncbi:MAG: PorV/PorQ family protein [Bacteroidota bacterium]
MKHKYLICTLILAFLINPQIKAGETKVGTSAANFMKIEVGARASALGGAFVSISNDLTSMYWNPAGLANYNSISAQIEHLQLYAGIVHNFGGLSIPLGSDLTIGLNAIYLTSGDIEITTESQWDGTGQFYEVSNMSLGVSVAKKMTDRLLVGLNLKYLRESISRNSASSFAADFGLLLHTDIYGLNIGMNLSNVGPPMKMSGIDMQFQSEPDHQGLFNAPAELITEEWAMPTTFRMGLSAEIIGAKGDIIKSDKSTLLSSVDLSSAVDYNLKSNIGIEYVFDEQFSIRSGYRIGYSESSFSAGAGVKIIIGGLGLFAFDYSYSDFGVFDGVHRFGIMISQ